MTIKKTSVTSNVLEAGDVLRDEYRFDYTKSKPNRFAGKAEDHRGRGSLSRGC